MSENSIEFFLSNSEQRDSWLNSGHRTLDTDSFHIATNPTHTPLPSESSFKPNEKQCDPNFTKSTNN